MPLPMRWDYPPLEINPVFSGLREIIITIIIIITVIIIIIIIIIITIIIAFTLKKKKVSHEYLHK